ncbi:hypothetical protein P301_B10396 [Saccharomyces cerevisiae P301]|nr:hypothetical protein P301_B10396 [Saccharomyces cerevisiae P301]
MILFKNLVFLPSILIGYISIRVSLLVWVNWVLVWSSCFQVAFIFSLWYFILSIYTFFIQRKLNR